jgi:hypothetical protein
MEITCLQELCVFAFFHTLFNELQRLLHILRVNGILNLVVAAYEHRVIAGAHPGGVAQLELDNFRSPYLL